MKKITLFILLLLGYQAHAQIAPIDFEAAGNGAAWTWTVFENAGNPALEILANPDATGINVSATVAKFTALQAGNPWAGCESMHGADIGSFTFTPSNSLVKIMVWKPVISDIGIKFVEPSSAALPEIKVANTLVNQWEEITFDFSALENGITYDQIVVFPDFDLGGRTQDNICYFDNISFNAQPAGPDPGDITFSVDMTEFGTPFTTVSIFGTFNGWNSGSNPLTNMGGGLWQGTVTMPGGNNEYKFVTDVGEEIFDGSEPCTTPPAAFVNRIISVDGDATASTVCFESCDPCAGGGMDPNAPIDFEPTGQGALWTWTVFENDSNPALEILANPDPSGINVSATVAKFTALQAGQPFAGVESMHGADIGEFVLTSSNSLVKIMVWKPVISDVGIKFVENSGAALPEIKVANTLVNQWEELTFDFSALENGITYDQIVIFPDFNARGQDNICYFDNITFNEQPAGPAPGDITFSVDMSEYANSFTTVYLSGAFNGWNGTSNPLTDMGNGVWGGTVNLPAGNNEYKFTLDNWAAQEMFNGSESCTTDPAEFVNRLIVVDGDATAPEVCWNSCLECGAGPAGGSIAFSVDMSNYSDPFTQVYISGTFNGWSGESNPLTNIGNGIWEGSVAMPGGNNEYKFSLDNWNDEEIFDGSESCTTDPAEFVNRVVAVDGNGSVSTVCFDSCDACPPANVCSASNDINPLFGGGVGIPQTSMIVDNTNNSVTGFDPATGWDCFGEPDGGGSAPSLENTIWFSFTGDGNEYFIETVECGATDYIEDGDTQIAIYSGPDCANLTPVACNEDGPNATAGDFRAGLDLATEAGTIYWILVDGFNLFDGTQISAGEFCIEVTQNTAVDVDEVEFESGIHVYPNPAGDFAVIEYSFPESIDLKIELTNTMGQIVFQSNENGLLDGNVQLDIAGIASGVYFLTMSDGTNQLTEKLIIQKP